MNWESHVVRVAGMRASDARGLWVRELKRHFGERASEALEEPQATPLLEEMRQNCLDAYETYQRALMVRPNKKLHLTDQD